MAQSQKITKTELLDKIKNGEPIKVRLRCLKSREYLHPVDRDYTEDARRRRVLSVALADVENNEEIDWWLEPVQHRQDYPPKYSSNVVRLSSVIYPGEYLLAGTDELTVDLKRRKVYTWKEKDTDFSEWGGPDEWFLLEHETPADVKTGTLFTLRNKKFEEDLVGTSDRFEFNEHFGTVFTWREEAGNENINSWEIVTSDTDQTLDA